MTLIYNLGYPFLGRARVVTYGIRVNTGPLQCDVWILWVVFVRLNANRNCWMWLVRVEIIVCDPSLIKTTEI